MKIQVKRKCDNCGIEYKPDKRNLKRGWGLCCSKSCAAKKREMSRPDYNPDRVVYNNLKRAGLLSNRFPDLGDYDPSDSEYWNEKEF